MSWWRWQALRWRRDLMAFRGVDGTQWLGFARFARAFLWVNAGHRLVCSLTPIQRLATQFTYISIGSSFFWASSMFLAPIWSFLKILRSILELWKLCFRIFWSLINVIFALFYHSGQFHRANRELSNGYPRAIHF